MSKRPSHANLDHDTGWDGRDPSGFMSGRSGRFTASSATLRPVLHWKARDGASHNGEVGRFQSVFRRYAGGALLITVRCNLSTPVTENQDGEIVAS